MKKCKQCRQPLEEWEVGIYCEGCGMSNEKKAAADKLFAALWTTRNRGDSVPIALEQQGIDVIEPDEQDKINHQLSVTVDGFEFFVMVHDG